MPSASLKYSDTTDRAFGLCGMALALFIYDAEGYISAMSIDAPADDGLALAPEFFIVNNPNLSAKAVWNGNYRRFQLASAMYIGNLLSRSLTRRRAELSREVTNLMLSHLLKEGEDACGLEPAEVRQILAEPFDYLRRIFMHPRVNETIASMAGELARRHTLERDRIMAYLRPLNGI